MGSPKAVKAQDDMIGGFFQQPASLEYKPQAQLHDSRIVCTVHFGVADVVSAVARFTWSRHRGTEDVDQIPLGMVKRVEGLPPELQV